MASWKEWAEALSEVTGEFVPESASTHERYSAIVRLGLRTVDWETHRVSSPEDVDKLRQSARTFVDAKAPCLFIYDPLVPGVAKGYLFNVSDPGEVEQWIDDHFKALGDYDYLLSTQVSYSPQGFVATALSDGHGNIYCESLHKPEVCNHRRLSQPKGDITAWLNRFCIDNGELVAFRGVSMRHHDIRRVVDLYGHLRGEFEFVKGEHLGEVEFVTTGYETRPFPHKLRDHFMQDIGARLRATLIRRGEI